MLTSSSTSHEENAQNESLIHFNSDHNLKPTILYIYNSVHRHIYHIKTCHYPNVRGFRVWGLNMCNIVKTKRWFLIET